MLVKCISNKVTDVQCVTAKIRLARSINIDGPVNDLKIDQEYAVQAIEFCDNALWLFLHTVYASPYPYPYPAEFFEIIDGTVNPQWVTQYIQSSRGTTLKRLAMVEWALDDSYYERLIDGDVRCELAYRKFIATASY